VRRAVYETRQEAGLPELVQLTPPNLDAAACSLARENRPNAHLLATAYDNRKVIAYTDQLKKEFASMEWIMWDERLTSKMAGKITSRKTKEDKLQVHSVAAAYILSSYIEFLNSQKSFDE